MPSSPQTRLSYPETVAVISPTKNGRLDVSELLSFVLCIKGKSVTLEEIGGDDNTDGVTYGSKKSVSEAKDLFQSINSRRESVGMPQSNMDAETLHKQLLEREKELEVAAKLGQLLLKRNELLESDLEEALDLKDNLASTAAQLKHDVAKKEEILKLYLQEYEADFDSNLGESDLLPDWIQMLREESKNLRDDNMTLRHEADDLRFQSEELEQKERDLIQQCMKQLAEANTNLADLQSDVGVKSSENIELQKKLQDLTSRMEELKMTHQHVLGENVTLRDNLQEAHSSQNHLASEVMELQEKHGSVFSMLKEAQGEIEKLRDSSDVESVVSSTSTAAEQKSLVEEIEESIRREVLQAMSLPNRPESPQSYAQSQAKVVMETVKSVVQSQQKREKLVREIEELLDTSLASEEEKMKKVKDTSSTASATTPPLKGSTKSSSFLQPRSSSPVPSEVDSVYSGLSSVGDELKKYRGSYVAPEKLQIVKPMEGSLTLLKWKLLATPHLGGASTFFSPAYRPGIHVKAIGVTDTPQSTTSTDLDESFSKSISRSQSNSINIASKEEGQSSPLKSMGRKKTSRLSGKKVSSESIIDSSPKLSKHHTPITSRGSNTPKSMGGVGLASLLGED